MVEPKQLAREGRCLLLGQPVVRRTDQKATTWSLFSGVGQRHGCRDMAIGTDQRAAALVRIGLFAMPADGEADPFLEHDSWFRHRPSRRIH